MHLKAEYPCRRSWCIFLSCVQVSAALKANLCFKAVSPPAWSQWGKLGLPFFPPQKKKYVFTCAATRAGLRWAFSTPSRFHVHTKILSFNWTKPTGGQCPYLPWHNSAGFLFSVLPPQRLVFMAPHFYGFLPRCPFFLILFLTSAVHVSMCTLKVNEKSR